MRLASATLYPFAAARTRALHRSEVFSFHPSMVARPARSMTFQSSSSADCRRVFCVIVHPLARERRELIAVLGERFAKGLTVGNCFDCHGLTVGELESEGQKSHAELVCSECHVFFFRWVRLGRRSIPQRTQACVGKIKNAGVLVTPASWVRYPRGVLANYTPTSSRASSWAARSNFSPVPFVSMFRTIRSTAETLDLTLLGARGEELA